MMMGVVRPIGRTELRVGPMGLGGTAIARIPGPDSERAAMETLQTAWDAGIRYFDTAPSYGFGLSEHRIGAALRSKPRDEWIISTKVGRVLTPAAPGEFKQTRYAEPLPFKPHFRYDYDGVMRSFEDSLQRLGQSRIDVLLVHDLTSRHHPQPDVLAHHTEQLFGGGGYRALLSLRDQKVVSAFGAGLNSWEQCEYLAERGDFNVFLLAGHYTLLDQDALQSFLPMCVARHISVVMGGVYNTGILATGPIDGAQYDYRPATPEVLERTRAIEAVCREFETPLTAAALQFPLRHPAVCNVIPGMSSPDEVRTNVADLKRPAPAALYESLKAKGLLDSEAPTAEPQSEPVAQAVAAHAMDGLRRQL